MRPVSGFLSDDGNFFELKASADKHDAEMLIRAWCVEQNIDAEKLITYIEALADPILEFVNASREEQKINKARASIHPEPIHAREHQTDDTQREEDVTTVLEQPFGGLKSMSYLGGGTQPEVVLVNSEGDGS